MAFRVGRALTLMTVPALIVGSASAAAALTDRNSVNPAFRTTEEVEMSGIGCGTSGSAVRDLRQGASRISVLAPKAGARDPDGDTRVTDVSVAGTKITVTVVADGPRICGADPDQGPPETRPWSARYDVSADYRRRIRTLIRTNFTTNSPTLRSAPRTVFTDKVGNSYGKVVGIRWKRFGSKRATGRGVYRERPRGFDHNRRVKLVASPAGFCRQTRTFEYLSFRVSTLGGRLVRRAPVSC